MWFGWLLQDSSDTLAYWIGGGGAALLTAAGTFVTKVWIPAAEKARNDRLGASQKALETEQGARVRIAELEAQVEESRNAAILDLKNSTTEMSQSVKDLIKEIRENSSRQQERLERFVNQTDERFSAHSAQLGAVSALAHDAQHSARPAV